VDQLRSEIENKSPDVRAERQKPWAAIRYSTLATCRHF
jgi:hypothetical protein